MAERAIFFQTLRLKEKQLALSMHEHDQSIVAQFDPSLELLDEYDLLGGGNVKLFSHFLGLLVFFVRYFIPNVHRGLRDEIVAGDAPGATGRPRLHLDQILPQLFGRFTEITNLGIGVQTEHSRAA